MYLLKSIFLQQFLKKENYLFIRRRINIYSTMTWNVHK